MRARSLSLATVEASYGMAYRDELTGLPARRALREACSRLGHSYAVAMVDVDHFKRFNDRFGHDVGDQVLKLVASRLGRVRDGGRAFRYGGEEFTVLFPGRDADTAEIAMEPIRAEIAGWDFVLRGVLRPRKRPTAPRTAAARAKRRVTVTISIGIAQHEDGDTTDPEQVIKAADAALYRAKRDGRNRICR